MKSRGPVGVLSPRDRRFGRSGARSRRNIRTPAVVGYDTAARPRGSPLRADAIQRGWHAVRRARSRSSRARLVGRISNLSGAIRNARSGSLFCHSQNSAGRCSCQVWLSALALSESNSCWVIVPASSNIGDFLRGRATGRLADVFVGLSVLAAPAASRARMAMPFPRRSDTPAPSHRRG